MVAKGNRSQSVTDACKKYGGFYLGSIGGPAALLAKENITRVELLEFEELGMEAAWKIEVKDFPTFLADDMSPATGKILRKTGYEKGFPPQPAMKGGELVSDATVRDDQSIVFTLL